MSTVRTYLPSKNRAKLYRSVQKLLRSKNIRVTIKQIKRTPKRKIVRYIKRKFTPEEVAVYLPACLIFGKEKLRKLTKKSRKKTSELDSLNQKPISDIQDQINDLIYQATQVEEQAPDLHTNQEAADPNYAATVQTPAFTGPVTDINHPIEPTHEIAVSEEYQWNHNIFADQESRDFDPGLWLTIQQSLPSDYAIPDRDFSEALEKAQHEA